MGSSNSGTNLAIPFAMSDEVADDLFPASRGTGPLLQRDYWAVFAECPLSPVELMQHVKANFCTLPPPALVAFDAANGVEPDAELAIRIRPGQDCRVRVVHSDDQSLTLGTLEGHPEAGRITFGAYRNAAGELIFHIRSRARASTASNLLGFLTIGEAMQTNTWTDFITNTARGVGARIRDVVHADTERVDERPDDDHPLRAPTFAAVGN